MATVVTRAVKGINLTPTEADANLTNINTELMAATTNVASQGTAISTVAGNVATNATNIATNAAALLTKQDLPGAVTALAVSGTITLTFDTNKINTIAQAGNLTLAAAASGNKDGIVVALEITGNGTATLTFPGSWTNGNQINFDPTRVNTYFICRLNSKYIYANVPATILDIIPPSLISIATNSAGTQIILTYSKTLGAVIPATTDLVFSGKTNTAVAVTGATVIVTLSTAYLSSNTITGSYTPGTNKIQDIPGNFAASFSGISVTNNINSFANTKSLSVGATNQILSTGVVPTTLQFGNGTSETPMSISVYGKFSSAAAQQFLFLLGDNVTFGIFIALDATGKISFLMSSLAGSIEISTAATVALNAHLHIVATYDGSRTTGGMNIYINGSLISVTASGTGYAGKPTYPSATRLSIGGGFGGNPATNSLVDECYFFNTALTIAQAVNIYNSGVVKDPTTFSAAGNLVDGWRFENNGNSFNGGYTLTSSVAPTYSTDKP